VLSRVEKRARAGGEFGEVRKLSVKSGLIFISLACTAISSSKTNLLCYDFDRFRLYSCDWIQSVSDNAQASVQGAS